MVGGNIMNKSTTILACGILALACTRVATEPLEIQIPEEYITITATTGDAAETKVQLTTGSAANKMQLIWSPADRIGVYAPYSNEPFTLSSGSMSATAQFTGAAADIYTPCTDGGWSALYPYQSYEDSRLQGDSENGDRHECYLNAYQRATEGSFDRNSFLMLAHSATLGNFSFKPLVALLKVTPQFDCKQIYLTARQPSGTYVRISGGTAFYWNSGDPLMVAVPTFNLSSNSTSIILSGNIEAGKDYYMCVYPMEMPEGFDLSFVATDGTRYVRGTGKSFTPARGRIYDMGEFSIAGTSWTQTIAAPDANGHTFVDLGFVHDGKKLYFADRNLGASDIDRLGDTYYWGDVNPSPSTNSYKPGSKNMDIGGNVSYDAATNNWGGDWRIPGVVHLNILCYDFPSTRFLSIDWDTSRATNGNTFTSSIPGYEGATIFLPEGQYWTSEYYRSSGKYYCLSAHSSISSWSVYSPIVYQPIRPVIFK